MAGRASHAFRVWRDTALNQQSMKYTSWQITTVYQPYACAIIIIPRLGGELPLNRGDAGYCVSGGGGGNEIIAASAEASSISAIESIN